MDLYSNPPEDTYLLGLSNWFDMPTETGTIKAVAVSKSVGDSFNSAYTIIITLIFVAVGKLVADVVLTFLPVQKNPNRMAMLVAFYNTGDMFSLQFLLMNFVSNHFRNVKIRREDRTIGRDWKTIAYGVFLLLVAAAVFIGGVVTGILVPQNLLMGTVARANPRAIFYYNPPSNAQDFALKEAFARVNTVAALRSMGVVEQSGDVIDKKIKFREVSHPDPTAKGNISQPALAYEYSYSLTGFELGLQRAPTLKQTVTGKCRTEYSWFTGSTPGDDAYLLWPGEPIQLESFVLTNPDLSPGVVIEYPGPSYLQPAQSAQLQKSVKDTGTMKYAIVPQLAGRRRRFSSISDPWYWTAPLNDTSGFYSGKGVNFRILNARPVISCEETLKWSFKGKEYTTLSLAELKGVVPLSEFWTKVVFEREFGMVPKLVQLTNALGSPALATATQNFGLNGYIDSPVTNTLADMKRLVMLSYVGARESVRNTALLNLNIEGLGNAIRLPFEGNSGEVSEKTLDARADFVLQSSEIQTLSVTVLITTPIIFLLLWLIIASKRQIVSADSLSATNFGVLPRYAARSTALAAVQLYRYLDEAIFGERRWDGRLSSAPFVADLQHYTHEKQVTNTYEVIPISAQSGKPKDVDQAVAEKVALFTTPSGDDIKLWNPNGITQEAIPAQYYTTKIKPAVTVQPSIPGASDDGKQSPENKTSEVPEKRPGMHHTMTKFSESHLPIGLLCIEPKLVPLYEHVSQNPEAAESAYLNPITGKPSYLRPVPNKFELAMTTVYREQIANEQVKWSNVAENAVNASNYPLVEADADLCSLMIGWEDFLMPRMGGHRQVLFSLATRRKTPLWCERPRPLRLLLTTSWSKVWGSSGFVISSNT